MKKNSVRIVVLVVLAVNLLLGYYSYRKSRDLRGGDKYVMRDLGRLAKMLKIIRSDYVAVDKVTSDALLNKAMDGLAGGLDEHSSYFRPRAANSLNAVLSGKLGGVGISMAKIDGHVMIVFVGRNGPAAKAGVQAWDEILSVDGESVKDKSYEDIVQAVRGEIGTAVDLEVQRGSDEGAAKLSFKIVRGNISTPSVWNSQVIENTNCAYFNIQGFIENTPNLLEDEIKRLMKEHPAIDSMILDLRGNGGGLMDCAVKICGFFLPEGQLVVTSRTQNAEGFSDKSLVEHNHYAGAGFKVDENIKLAVLIDRNSASASEITAGCMQDLGRAIIVGEKSYGKGSVQSMFSLGGGSALKLTIAHYCTPNKERIIDGVGISPDVECKMLHKNGRESHRRRLFDKMHPQYDSCVKAALEAMGVIGKAD